MFEGSTSSQSGESSQSHDAQTVTQPSVKQEMSSECALPLNQLQKGSAPVPHHPPDPQEEESHENHCFEWCIPGKNPTTITCDKPRRIEATLMTSSQFRAVVEKNKNKELFILLEGKVISSHFPCCLIKNQRLNVRFLKKTACKQPVRAPVPRKVKVPSSKLVLFHIQTKGGKNAANITINPALKNNFQEMTVYGYRGESLKQALRRDGRLQSKVIKNNFLLSRITDDVTTEMSQLVDDLDGKTFKLIRCKTSTGPESLPSSLEEADIAEDESARPDQSDFQISETSGSQVPPQQSATVQLVNDGAPEGATKQNGLQVSVNMWIEMPNSRTMKEHLSDQFDHLVKGKKTEQGSKLSRVQNLFHAEFGKNAQTCREVKTMKKLMDLSNSVCHVRINEKGAGSGFLLFDRFVLTNCHVIKDTNGTSCVTVHFCYESLSQADEGVRVEEATVFEYYRDKSGVQYDWALLKLSTDENLPVPLLNHFGFLPQSGAICIIGHPEDGVKKIDPCMIIPGKEQKQVMEKQFHKNPDGVFVDEGHYGGEHGRYVHLLTDQFFGFVSESVQNKSQDLTYESCFYFGSSGSPVFDEHCKVIAMHTGGFPYNTKRGEQWSVLEFGSPLSAIIEHMIVQLVERGKLDVFKKYLAYHYAGHDTVMTNVKRLYQSRNSSAFEDAVRRLSRNDSEPCSQMLLDFCGQREEPVPMELNRAWKH